MINKNILTVAGVSAGVLLANPATAELKYENKSGGSTLLYGVFDPSYLTFDDGVSTTGLVVDNDNLNSRVGLEVLQPFGASSFRFQFETGLGLRASSAVSQNSVPKAIDWQKTSIRKFDFSLKNETYGTFHAGQGKMATDDVAENDLSGTTLVVYASVSDTAGSFLFRTSTGALSGITISDMFSDLDGDRLGRIRYDTPTFGGGFVVSVSYGKDILDTSNTGTRSDAAVTYNNSIGDFKVSGAVGFSRHDQNGVDQDKTIGSISVLHASGVSGVLAAGRQTNGGEYVYGKIGYQARWFSAGGTAFSVGYYDGRDFNLGVATSSSSNSFGFGAVQSFDKANVKAYLGYRTYDVSDNTATTYQDASSILFGARWRF